MWRDLGVISGWCRVAIGLRMAGVAEWWWGWWWICALLWWRLGEPTTLTCLGIASIAYRKSFAQKAKSTIGDVSDSFAKAISRT